MPISEEEAWGMFSDASRVLVARGKNVLEFVPDKTNKAALLKEAIGRSGTLRAPTLRVGQMYYVGFQLDMYQRLAG